MISRAAWGSRVTSPDRDSLRKRVMVIHHSAFFGLPIDTPSEQKAAMRSMQRFHMDQNGWADIGYLGVVFQPFGRLKKSRAYVGRGQNNTSNSVQDYIPAAQTGANSGTIPICIVGNFVHERLKRKTRRRLIRIAKNLKREYGITHVAMHRQFGGTTCPGDNAAEWVDNIARAAGLKFGRP